MMFCPNCGHNMEGPAIAAVPAESDEVRIARINAERDVKVAQLAARQERDWNESREAIAETEASAAIDVATAEAEVIGAILDAENDTGADPEAEPLIIEAPAPEPEPEPDNSPPPVEHHAPPKKNGWWDAYR